MTVHNNGDYDIDAELKRMWDSVVAQADDVYRTTKTRIKAIEVKMGEHDEIIQKHEGVISRFLRAFNGAVKG
jgi:hypothetical protein